MLFFDMFGLNWNRIVGVIWLSVLKIGVCWKLMLMMRFGLIVVIVLSFGFCCELMLVMCVSCLLW